MIKPLLLLSIVLINGYFLFTFIKDLLLHKEEMKAEKANGKVLPFTSFIMFFLSTFGISDFAIGSVLYPKLGWTSMKKLPGTLNTQCVIPVATMALSYITSIDVGIKTLLVCIVSQVIGAYVGPRFVVKLPERTIKLFVGVGLIVAAGLIFAGQMNWIKSNGTATELYGGKLILAAALLFLFGALNNIGIGSYSLTMVTVYMLGLNPAAAFPIMMGACTFSVPVGSVQFVKFGEYSRKITLYTATFGVLGVLAAVFLVKNLNVTMLKWLVIVVLIYSAYSMLSSLMKAEKATA
ncbi:sulfite exporter TauE/SafE family protein [Vagococcus lutrae]|uniref:sulfite exporter TauE/SafE family protein n=1 Tax=Vagococcus lutrae TaxID=81947 RepID=UPI0019281EBA|nr:sulfite exporter TauE/SafE family protein [Vagococcus lutrae]MDO5742062.1 sulfite exporter TauE/SafE family protein [Vagococcus sp.]MCO7151648.1 sulfite exporter TauE/SafE family protein [Vagococcus lutrae]MDT2801601.1 sulfite exporter TauE/SafE family protein [Vagococcus lutrae]MDT2808411.1 sulfite exporter TauE/SafE family protein [Vagococcus lutrae]MDT2813174.1 sulfite exporter TauE/SafE family protein [Vagococcus lutrae]